MIVKFAFVIFICFVTLASLTTGFPNYGSTEDAIEGVTEDQENSVWDTNEPEFKITDLSRQLMTAPYKKCPQGQRYYRQRCRVIV